MSTVMTGKQRIFTALELKEPDQVPLFEIAMNEESILKLARHFTDDVPALKSVYDMTMEEQIQILDLLALVHTELGIDAVSTVFILQKERIDEEYVKDKHGTIYRLSGAGEATPVDGPVQGPADLSKVANLEPDPMDYIMLRYMIPKMGEEVAHSFSIPDPFRFAWQLRGAMEKFLLDYMKNPDFALELTRITTDFCMAACELAADIGSDIVALEGDLAFNTSTLMSPDQYKKFIMPFHVELVEAIHKKGMKVLKHSDGNLWPILDDLLEAGFDAIHPIQPQSMDIKEVKKHLAKKAAIVGNIDCSFLLPFGSEEEVEQSVKDTIKIAAPGGGYIMSSSNTIHPGVKSENYIAMVKAARKYGRYPIELGSVSKPVITKNKI